MIAATAADYLNSSTRKTTCRPKTSPCRPYELSPPRQRAWPIAAR